jgi:putative transposase
MFPERAGARELLDHTLAWFTWLRLLWVDSGYSGPDFAQWVKSIQPKLEVEVVKRTDDLKGFKVLPHRWVVERTFGWFMRRRLVRDYETSESSRSLDLPSHDPNSNPPPRLIPSLNSLFRH